ncbi:hypothetical protein HOLleu_30183 [Holothuria leucospilota]|uniref:DNA-directed DNA polymerase n=1 Tax=Holothuria leucospilota TaxID=206669 RepID=A0A9Q1BK60_HOLLE|nr:hypothetical protein HOLleu_30183 [Holothuria leucospilota]
MGEDFYSLYPFTNKYCSYLVGHPQVLTSDLSFDISLYYGVARVQILPPRTLFHPVLPLKANDKLIFPLCNTCAQSKLTDRCNHSDSERALTGTWVTLELEKAVEIGYKILKVDIVWNFTEKSRYDKDTKSGGLFTEYVNTFLKVKQEASGWPTWCVTQEDRKRYVREYAENEGIDLDVSNIKHNPGLRALSKLMLNSFWGKFGQRSDLEKTEVVSEVERLYDLLKDTDETEVTNLRFINDDIVEVCYKDRTDFERPNARVNGSIAAFTTCHARLRLYEVLQRLGERVLYYDTDSVIYISKPGEWDPPIGDYLGDP